jgi:hypothetical protein
VNKVPLPVGDAEFGLQYRALKMRQSKGSPRPIILEADLGQMYISNKMIDLQDVVDDEEEEDSSRTTQRGKRLSKR